MFRSAVVVLCLLTGVVAAQPAPAKLGPGSLVVQTANNTVQKLLAQQVTPGSPAAQQLATQIANSVRGFLDVQRLGARAMAPYWSTLTPAQQTLFATTLEQLVQAQYVKAVGTQQNVSVKYLGEKTLPNGNLYVETEYTTSQKGRPVTVQIDYELEPQGATWRAIDMVTAGVGLVSNYAAMFNKLMTQGGFANLMGKMTTKLSQIAPATPAPQPGAAPAPAAPAPAAPTPARP